MTRSAPVDSAIRDRIRTDLGSNLCVEAGAGTGKTTVLVARIVAVLRTGAATVDEVAVITFTEAAAAELAARVRQGLESALDEAADPDERDRVQAALLGLHRAHVETIHAFAAGLLRERPVEAGLDPGFEILDGLPAQLAFDEEYERWLTALLDGDRPEVATAVQRGLDLTHIRQLVETVNQHRSLLPFAPETPQVGAVDGFLDRLKAIAGCLRSLLRSAGTDEVGVADIEGILDWWDRLAAVRDDPRELDRELLSRAPRLSPNLGRKGDWDDPDACTESKALRREVRDAIPGVQAALRTEALVGLLPHAQQFADAFERRRRAEGSADFDDLLEWARDLLATSPEARADFRRRFRVLMVDEFQDTDPVQADIVMCIASDDEPGEDWLQMRPRPGALMVVGDPKQSIYRFRRADIGVYDAVRHGPLSGCQAQLVQNFRSTARVLEWANPVFDALLVPEPGVQVENTPLVPGSTPLSDEARAVVVVHGEPQGSADGNRQVEAHLLVRTIQQAVSEGWPVRDQHTGRERPTEYGDVVVLLPRRTALDIYLDAFRRAGVPVRAEGGRSFFQRQEVRDLANTLQAVDDPLDQVALVASLRSVVFGCSDQDIYLHVAAGNRLDYRIDPTDSPAPVAESLRVLRGLHRRRAQVSLTQLVRETLERTRLVEIALSGWDGQQSAANLLKLAEHARDFSASGAGALRAFARWLTQQRASSDEAEANVAEETDDVVQIMTIHASKGLEFPVVAFANLGSQPWNHIEPVPDRTTRRLHLRIARQGHEFTTPGFPDAWDQEKHRMAAEEKRLLYVAATRARDHLIIPLVIKDTDTKSLQSELRRFLPERDPATVGSHVNGCLILDPGAFAPLPDDDPPLDDAPDERVIDEALGLREAWASTRADVLHAARDELAVHPATADEGDQPVPAAFLDADDAPLIVGEGPPADKGEAMHRVLELIDLVNPAGLGEVAASVCALAGIPEHTDEVLALVTACLASPVVERARQARRRWREVPYTLRVKDGYATGRIDLVFEEDGQLVVVDWKSDTVGPAGVAAAAARHREQGAGYATALTAATGIPVKQVVFVFPRAPGEHPVAGTSALTHADTGDDDTRQPRI